MTKPLILFRASTQEEREEMQIASKYFDIAQTRCRVANHDHKTIIGRYSVLPYYKELEADLDFYGKHLINSHREHSYIAKMDWYHDLKGMTPKTWWDYNFYVAPEQAYVVKGCTNSKKQVWNKKMFAPTRSDAVEISCELLNDMCIADQDIVYRKYIPLKTFETAVHGLPVTNEWRFFFLGKVELCHAYYWRNTASDEATAKAKLTEEGIKIAHKAAAILSKKTNFFVVDIAETAKGDWIVIEVNDGQMSGVDLNVADDLYRGISILHEELD